MRSIAINISILLVLSLSSCSLKEVQNPNITDASFIGSPQSSQAWLNGMYRQLALVLNETVIDAEITSDNYYNNSSLSNKVFDIPTILYSDLDIDNMQRAIGRLKEMYVYGINSIAPADRNVTDSMKAEMFFLGAYAYMLGGELYNGLPMSAGSPIGSSADHFNKAIEYLKQATTLQRDNNKKNIYTLAMARAYYYLGDKVNASDLASLIINNNPLLLAQARFDGVKGVSNTMQTYTFSSSTNTYAPLPRLDFLDPKYFHVANAANEQKPIAILKGEEAFLIMAESQLGNANISQAKTTLKNLINNVVNKRPTASINGKSALRKGNRSDYPLLAVAVKFDPQSAPKPGFVLERQAGNIKVYTVSGTSVTADDIDKASTVDEMLYLLCLMRQEIFMSEGRRMTDLGIRYPVSQIEQKNNPAVNDEFTKAIIPSFIPQQLGMDDFTYDKPAGIVTMKFDMNKVLVANKNAPRILPMLK